MPNRTEAATNASAAPDKKGEGENSPAAAPSASGGGFKAFIPLLANILIMPALAFALAHFYLLPRLSSAKQDAVAAAKAPGTDPQKARESKAKVTAPLGGKILVNVAGTAGTRYLLASMTLVGTGPELKSLVETHDAQLRDAAAAILAAKTIADLEKPGVRNLVRTEMISIFNDIFGKSLVTEIYLTEFAIQ